MPIDTETLTTKTPTEPRLFHTLLTFRCPSTLSEALADYGVQHGTTSISAVIRDLLTKALAAHA